MPAEEMRLRILGRPGEIDAVALQRGVAALLELLRARGLDDFVVTDLRLGSLELAVRPRDTGSPDFEGEFVRIVREIQDLGRSVVPEDAPPELLDGVVSLSRLLDLAGVEGLELGDDEIGRAVVDPSVRRVATEAVQAKSVSIGSVRGRIHRFLDHKRRREVSVEDQGTGRSVRVTFPKSMLNEVLAAVDKQVLASGELRRDRFGRKVSLRLQDLEVISEVEVYDVDEMRGALGRDWTRGVGSVDAVRRQRGRED